MSKRGAGERDFTPSQGNMRKARVEVRRVDAIQLLMAAARARNSAPPQQQPPAAPAAAAAGAAAGPGSQPVGPATAQLPQTPATATAAPCTHCGTVLPVYADTCSLRQCCGCLDVFCSLCSVLDYEEREDRVFCLGCLDDQTAPSRGGGNRGGGGGRAAEVGSGSGAATTCLSIGLSLPIGSATGRWGQLDMLGGVGGPTRSPFPCSRTPQHHGQTGSRTPGSALYSSRSHRGFSALLGYAGAES